MPTDPAARTAAREAARVKLAALFPDHGLTDHDADGFADAVLDTVQPLVRAAAFAEAEQAIRTTDLPEDHIDLFDNGADWAAGLVHDLGAAAAPAPTAVVPPCRCGHDRAEHDPATCLTRPKES